MPENVRSQKWLTVSFFLVCALVFLVFIYVISSGTVDRSYQTWMATAGSRSETDSRDAGTAEDAMVVAAKDQQVILGDILLTYRGLASGQVRIDLVILALDPRYVYHRRIPVEEAEKGIEIAGRRFKVLSMNRQRIKLFPVKPSI